MWSILPIPVGLGFIRIKSPLIASIEGISRRTHLCGGKHSEHMMYSIFRHTDSHDTYTRNMGAYVTIIIMLIYISNSRIITISHINISYVYNYMESE